MPPKLTLLTSGEFAKAIGVHPLTLKRWYDSEKFLPVKLSSRGYKFYSPKQIKLGIKFKESNKRS